MVLTNAELLGSLQNEVRILLHLASKVDAVTLDYRPTPKQRSTLELLQYLSFMGPVIISSARAGVFDPAAWTSAQQGASARTFDETLRAIATLPDEYASLLADVPGEAFRAEIEMFGRRSSLGAFIVNTVLCGYAAYRTQLFLYLKACGRHELTTMNLWAGMDPVPA